MTFALRKHIPGRADINDAFSKPNLPRMKRIYKKLVDTGEYHFGDLSALFCGLDDKERSIWDKEVAAYYPPDVQDEVVRVIQAALFHKDEKGYEYPIPIEFSWIGSEPNGPAHGVRTTYNHREKSYQIELIGYPPPLGSSLFDRRSSAGPEAEGEAQE
jgi:hypothetical protein